MLPLCARMNLGATSMKEYPTFPKAPVLLEPHIRLFNVINRTLLRRGIYFSAEMQSVYSTAPAGRAIFFFNTSFKLV